MERLNKTVHVAYVEYDKEGTPETVRMTLEAEYITTVENGRWLMILTEQDNEWWFSNNQIIYASIQ